LNSSQSAGTLGQPTWLEAIYAPVRAELEQVESILRAELTSDAPWIDELLQHSRIVGGKRMRPVCLLLSGASCGQLGPSHLSIAASLEMIHTATLIHDDVLDRADTRRNGPTANSRWGNKASVLLGDYLFTHAFHVATTAECIPALRRLAAASNRVCGGEMRQNAWAGNFALAEEDYLEMIADKTAELCSVACELGAQLAGADQPTSLSFGGYGRDLGIAFQIVDDVLDLVGHPETVGKTLGTDIALQKATLPIIHCLNSQTAVNRAKWVELLEQRDVAASEVMRLLNSTGSIEYARTVALSYCERATEFANSLPASEYATSLQNMAQFVLQRSY
jgi:octaprenyl-diphosphate synthase